jgi:uncharacterized membrane protein
VAQPSSGRFARWWLRFRAGPYFSRVYTAVWASWIGYHWILLRLWPWLPNFDPEFILLNLALSIDAGYMTPMFIRQSAADREFMEETAETAEERDKRIAADVRRVLVYMAEEDNQ